MKQMSVAACGVLFVAGVLCFGSDDKIATPTNFGQVGALIEHMHNRIGTLEGEVDSLRRRVVQIEKAPAAAAPGASNAVVVQLMEIQQVRASSGDLARAAQLESQADKLDEQARVAERALAGVSDYDSDAKSKKVQLRKEASEYRDDAKGKRAEATRLRREASITRQRVIGWDGEREVVLVTERDLSGALTRLAPGAFITWRGTRTALNGEVQEYSVTSINETARPAGFVDGPKRSFSTNAVEKTAFEWLVWQAPSMGPTLIRADVVSCIETSRAAGGHSRHYDLVLRITNIAQEHIQSLEFKTRNADQHLPRELWMLKDGRQVKPEVRDLGPDQSVDVDCRLIVSGDTDHKAMMIEVEKAMVAP